MPHIARHLMILGKVQGVFYRDWTVGTARDLGLSGWVRNRMEGSVEAVVQGEADAVEQFVALAHEGPQAARVARIEAADIDVAPIEGFDRRPTA